jgi:hypothetical protein
MLHHVALVKTEVSEEPSASIVRVTTIGVLGMLAVTSKPTHGVKKYTVRKEETWVLTGATWHNIPEDAILHSHRRENLKSFTKNVFRKNVYSNV